jgi:predicted extracellular nuclease
MRKYLALLMLCLPMLGIAQNYNVTFKVNTANITVGPNGLYAGGGVIGGSNALQLTDPDGNGVYEGTTSLNGSAGGNFIFFNSPTGAADWGTKENLTGLPCADPANYDDRILPTFTQDTTLLFCFGSCATDTVCPVLPTAQNYTFQVDLSTLGSTSAYIRGANINSWAFPGIPMSDADGDGIWDITLSLMPGNYEFKYTAGTVEETLDPTLNGACTVTNFGFTNRYVTLGSADSTLPVVCWQECTACAPASTGCDELFFSEYLEGSGNNKVLELYNPTSSAISMGTYEIRRFNNGGTNPSTMTFPSSLSIPAYGTYVIANPSSASTILASADTTSTITYFNGDDALVLMNGTDTLDIIGVVGVDPGSSWPVGTGATANNTLVRKASVSAGQKDWSIGATEWDVYPSNTEIYLGSHASNCAPAPPTDFVVTFMVNTGNITVGPNGLYLGGGVIGGANAVQLADPDGDGIYVGTDTLNGSNGGNFIFLNSPSNAADWGTKENLTGLPCADPANYDDRILPTFTQDTTLLFCFGSCATDTVCPVLPTAQNYTFQVDLSTLGSTSAYIRGANINSWAFPGIPMSDADGDGIWDITLSLMPGNYEFKYTAGTVEETLDPTLNGACTVTNFGFTNRYVTLGSADSTLPVVCWQECTACAPASTGCDELFFSEYLEGSGNNKVLELYNPTSSAISMGTYEIRRFNNGGTNPSTMTFPSSLSIPAYGTYVIANPSSASTILASADTTSTITYFNGDDALVLMNGTDTLDIIGVVGVDPGSSWPVGTGATANNTLVRKASVSAGQKDWSIGATEWDVYPSNTEIYLGSHASNCAPPPPTFPGVVAINTFNSMDASGVADSLGAMKWVKVVVTSIDFDGNAGYSFFAEDATDGINIWNFADKSGYTTPMMGDSLFIHGEVEQFNGLIELKPDSIYLRSQGNMLPAASIETVLDETTESELIQLIGMTVVDATQWPTSTLTFGGVDVDITNGTDTMVMRIDSDSDIDGSPAPIGMFDVTGIGSQYDSFSPYDEGYQILPRVLSDIFEYPTIPTYAIGAVTTLDADGVADSLGVLCKVVGTVMGVDLQGSATAIQFTIHDGSDGLGVFSSAPAAQSYTVMEGDQVRLIGTISQFNGLTQINPDSIAFISSNNTLPTPTAVTQLGENTESELVTFTSATLVDPSQWTGSGSGFNVDITNGTDTIAMRIDNDVDLYSQAAPTGAFDVTGIGGQFDSSSPYTSGYQLLPRYQADIVPAAAVYVPKIVVSEIMPGSNASSWNADWFEIFNYGDTAVDLAGMSWDDESGISGTSTFPSVTVAPGEAVVVWDDVAANEDSLLVSWKLYPGSVQVISTDELTGSFPSLSQNGDGVYLFDAAGIELTKSEYISGTAGYSIGFDTTGASLGDAVDGVNGAYTSLNGDVGSPGNLTPNTGRGEFTLNGRIYPNPNTGQFNIEMDRTDNYTVEVMDVRGVVLSRMTVEGNTISIDVNVSAGMYLVRVSSARGTVTQRVQVL